MPETLSTASVGSCQNIFGKRALPLPSVSSCFQKCLLRKGSMKKQHCTPTVAETSPHAYLRCIRAAAARWPCTIGGQFQLWRYLQNHTLPHWFAKIFQWLIYYPGIRHQTVLEVGSQCLEQDAAHEPECPQHVSGTNVETWRCSHVEHFCGTVYLNSLVYGSPVSMPVHHRLWNMEESGVQSMERSGERKV